MSTARPTSLDQQRFIKAAPSAADTRSVAAAIRRSQARERLRAFALAMPLLALLLLSFGIPIAILLSRAVYDPTIANALPRTSAAMESWSGSGIPDDATLSALAADLKASQKAGNIAEFAKSLNARLPGARSQILKTARALDKEGATDVVPIVKSIPLWNSPEAWGTIERGRHPLTSFYLLSAVDLRWNANGSIERVSPDQAIFLRVFARTFLVAATVTLATLVLGFPLAYLIASAPKTVGAILIVAVLLPFWTSILVRTAAWTVLLQKFGLVNDFLLWLGISGTRLDLMYSRLGLILAMTHIQLPFTLLPIYSVMRTIQPSQMRAAYSLGGRPLTSFLRVYLPQVVPGIMAGCLLTFILCLGYYITPALIGGAGDQLISNFIANYVNVELNWEMAAALSFILLIFTMGLYVVFARMLGLDRLKPV